ncbi:MAG: nucleotidyltransferase family protein [Armatimonadota bacterium]|nr:nucleotidyltransferase family protein [bacterium]
MDRVDAIILAGAPADPGLAPEGVSISRAMIGLGNKTMLQWVVDALRRSSSICRIAAVGDVSADGLDMVIQPGENLVGNIKLGIDALKPSGHVLIVSSDIPLLTAESVDDFISRALKNDVDLAYPILPKAHCEKRYPEFKRTYLKTASGVFTGGNIMLVKPDFIERNWNAIAAAYAARKKIFKLARIIGVGVLLRAVIAQVIPQALHISMLERAVSRMLDARVAAIVSAYPEIGEDVDKHSDLEAVKKILITSGEVR